MSCCPKGWTRPRFSSWQVSGEFCQTVCLVSDGDPSGPSQQQLSLALSAVSAGGVGVLVNVDRVEEQLRSQGHQGVQVRGLSDSGWLLPRRQHTPGDCTDVQSCAPTHGVKMGLE